MSFTGYSKEAAIAKFIIIALAGIRGCLPQKTMP
jgi:hypothetical protein